MQVKLDDKVIFEISDVDIKILENDLLDVQAEIERRLQYIITHKVDQCYRRLHQEWMQKLQQDPLIEAVPLKREDFVKYVMALPDYKNRATLEAEAMEV